MASLDTGLFNLTHVLVVVGEVIWPLSSTESSVQIYIKVQIPHPKLSCFVSLYKLNAFALHL